MTRTACAALLLATACATTGAGTSARAFEPDDEPGGAPPPVAYGGEILRLASGDQGFRRPQLADEGCLGDTLRQARGAAGVENKVKFAVMRDGSLARFSYLTPVTAGQARSIEAAFGSCRWIPGFDPTGRPVAVWVIQPIKVMGIPPSAAE